MTNRRVATFAGARFRAVVVVVFLLAGACGGGDDDTGSSAPTTAPTTESAPLVTEPPATTQAPTTAPTSTAPESDWTTYTTTDGLPGNDIVSIDVHADGTTWALVAIDRDDLGTPTSLALSRYDNDGSWTSIDPPVALSGNSRLRAGPDGTAWLLGLKATSECGPNDVDFGPTGLWYFDGTVWTAERQGIPEVGDRVAYDAKVDSAGTLWTVGISSIGQVEDSFDPPLFSGRFAVSRFDDGSWSDVARFDHFFVGIDCQKLFIDNAGTVWSDWTDAVFPEGGGLEEINIHARLDGSSWTKFENQFDLEVGDQTDDLVLLGIRGIGAEGAYVSMIIGDVRAFAPDLTPPDAGDLVPFGGIVFDDESWGAPFTGEIMVTEGHTITPFIPRPGEFGLNGDVTATPIIVDDTIYLTGLGGVIRIDTDGNSTTITADDGLASNATHHITATAEGILWVATDSGISLYAPGGN